MLIDGIKILDKNKDELGVKINSTEPVKCTFEKNINNTKILEYGQIVRNNFVSFVLSSLLWSILNLNWF